MWHCVDWHHTYIPMYIVLYTRRLECRPFPMFIIPTFRRSFYSGFHMCLDLVSQKDKSLFKPKCRLEVLLYHLSQLFINTSSAHISVHQILTWLIIYVLTKYRFVITKWFTNHKTKRVKAVTHCCWWQKIYPHGKIHWKWPSLS